MIYMTRKGQKGFTLIELMIVVAIVGVLAVLAIYGVRKYIANAKTAEARGSVGGIAKLANLAYERETGYTGTLALGSQSTQSQRNLCANSTTVPSTPPLANKYQSQPSDWTTGDQLNGWQCLKFTMDNPQYFAYQYQSAGGNGTVAYTAFAWGDLNGDGVTSTFQVNGGVSGGVARFAPTIQEANPEE